MSRDASGRVIRPPHVRLASMADVTAELDFTPRPRARRTSGPTAPRTGSAASRATTAPRTAAAPRPVAAETSQLARPFDSAWDSQTAEPAAVVPGAGVTGRRTVTINGRGAERYSATVSRRRPTRRPHERDGFRPDRAAMWAVMLGVILVLVAATTSHAATISHRSTSAVQQHLTVAHHGVHRHTGGHVVRLRVR